MLNDKAIRTAFLISFIGHCLFLGMPGVNPSSFQAERPKEITVRIEIEKPLLLPKIDVMGEKKKLQEIEEKQKEPELKTKLEPQPEEIVMEEPLKEPIEVINPSQEAMLRYQDMVKQRIEEVRRYPYWAKRQGTEGTVALSFIVLSNGMSQNVEIVRSSGSKVLDEEAVATIKRSNPFPPIPNEIGTSFVQMEVSIVFTLQ